MMVNLVRILVSPDPRFSAMRNLTPLWDVQPDFPWRWCFSEAMTNSEIEWPGGGDAKCPEAEVDATKRRLQEIVDQVNAEVSSLSAHKLKVLQEAEAHALSSSAVAHEPDGALQVIRWN